MKSSRLLTLLFLANVMFTSGCTCSPSGHSISSDDEQLSSLPSIVLSEGMTIQPGRLPEGWPQDIPIMDGFSIVHSTSDSETGARTVFAEGKVDIDEAESYYKKLKGWNIDPTNTYKTSENVHEIGLIKPSNKSKCDIRLSPKDDKIQLTIIVFANQH